MSKIALTPNASGTGVFTIASPATSTDRTLTLPDEAGTIALAQSLSYVRLNTANGYGSTNTKIRRFTNVVNNVGSDITYADSATLGGTFTINTAGVYSISYSDQFVGTNSVGLSINSTQLSTAIGSIAAADILSVSVCAFANNPTVASATFFASIGAVVRAHGDGIASGSGVATCQLTIARVA